MFRNQYVQIVCIAIVVMTLASPLGFGRWFVKILVYIIGFPYFLWRWHRNRALAKTRRLNYEFLGNYIALFAHNPEILKYLRSLIEEGISEQDFQNLLQRNLENLKAAELEQQKKLIREQLEQEQEFKKMATEQQELLIQSKLSLEQIKFRQQLLEHLYQKMAQKYGDSH